jgi:hypothetical protein
LLFPNSVIPTGMADFLFRSRRANVGHGVEGPWQHVSSMHADGTIPLLRFLLSVRCYPVALPPLVSVNKGAWDKSQGPAANHEFNRAWLAACQRILKPNGSLWVSCTAHVIHSVGFAMQQLGFKLLNDISWVYRCTIARLLRDEPQSASQSLLPLFHPRHRNHHLGRPRQKIAARAPRHWYILDRQC